MGYYINTDACHCGVRTYSGEYLIKLIDELFLYFPSAVGEPPLCMSCACLFAVKHAVEEARAEIGKGDDYFVMSEYGPRL